MKFRLITLLLLIALSPSTAPAGRGPTRVAGGTIGGDTVWSGEVLVEGPVTVAEEASLVVKPGSSVRFVRDAGLTVEGKLKAEGGKDAPVTFTSADASPAAGIWAGINFSDSKEGSTIKNCRVEYAASVTISVCSPPVKGCVFSNGVQGIVLARKARPAISGNRIEDMNGGGILCEMGSAPVITGNNITRCGPNGIISSKDSGPVIKDNTITGCYVGINLSQPVPPVEDNTVKGNGTGVFVSMADSGLVLRGNHITENDIGLLCQQFAMPVIERNDISGNKKTGIVCFKAASPTIRNNRVAGNEEGISCEQLCNPRINANDIHGNNKGIYLDLSSYAVITGNNIYDNKVQIELGNMSSDWENRVNNKPVRGGQAQNITMSTRGKAVMQNVNDGAQVMGYVDATGNWWGETGVKEMDAKGPQANIKGFIDYYDVPTRAYEGYSGIFVQDRIKYDGWKKSRIKDAGI